MGRHKRETNLGVVDEEIQTCENYLKTILLMTREQGRAYVHDLSVELQHPYTTVRSVMPRLVQAGYIEIKSSGAKKSRQYAVLTPKGEELAQKTANRHETIKGWLIRLGISPEDADAEACRLEHGITDQTMNALKTHVRMAHMNKGMAEDETLPAAELMARMTPHPMQIPLSMSIDQKEQEKELKQLRKLVQRLGGTIGAKKVAELYDRAGGEAKLAILVRAAEKAGGADKVKTAVDDRALLGDIGSDWGGVKRLAELMARMKALGGRNTINQIESLIAASGSAKRFLKGARLMLQLWAVDGGGEE